MLADHQDFKDKGYSECCLCKIKLGPNWTERMQKLASEIPREQKQKFLDAMHSGKNVGQARIIAGLAGMDLGVASHILLENINHETINTLNKVAV